MLLRPEKNVRSRKYWFTDGPGTMRPDPEDCDCEAGDAGRIRFAKAPESNHYGGGEFKDVQNPDPQSERTEKEWTDPRTASGGSGPAYSGSRPPKNATNVGALGQPVIEARQDGKVGLAGTAAYDPRTNLSTVGRDPGLLYSTSAKNVGALKPDGMGSGKASTADVIRKINELNKRLWSRDADKTDKQPDDKAEAQNNAEQQSREEGPQVTKWALENPDGSRVEHERRVHAPTQQTSDRHPRASVPNLHSAGGQAGTLASVQARQRNPALVRLNQLNKTHDWSRH